MHHCCAARPCIDAPTARMCTPARTAWHQRTHLTANAPHSACTPRELNCLGTPCHSTQAFKHAHAQHHTHYKRTLDARPSRYAMPSHAATSVGSNARHWSKHQRAKDPGSAHIRGCVAIPHVSKRPCTCVRLCVCAHVTQCSHMHVLACVHTPPYCLGKHVCCGPARHTK